ncbi:ABC transporter substrate-binding protein [Paenibacillus sp. FSL H8-0332]|uniref:ABC transporter substrate-binding protein n=1 Tax=Paenibacillus sp. FSL H8-0332 TaxID=2954742 RepID=UPI0030D3935F
MLKSTLIMIINVEGGYILLFKRKAAIHACIALLLVFLTACGGEEGGVATQNTSLAPQFLTVQHKFGETDIPVHPQRIASINLEDMLLSLDLPVVLAVTAGSDNYLMPQLQARDIQVLPSLSPEAVLESNPDLIIAFDVITQEDYDALSKIAPTIVYNRRTWRSSITEIAKDLGQEEKAVAALKAHEEKVAQAREDLAPVIAAQPTVALVRVTAKDFRLYFPSILSSEQVQGYATALYHDLGLQADPLALDLQKKEPERENATISMELLPQIKADYIFVTVGSASGGPEDYKKDLEGFAEIEKSAVWKALPAYQQGNIYMVGAKHWISDGMLADDLKINDIVQALGK